MSQSKQPALLEASDGRGSGRINPRSGLRTPTKTKVNLIQADVLDGLDQLIAAGIQCDALWTSPPYWGLVDYQVEGQWGFNEDLETYIKLMGKVFRKLSKIMVDGAPCWLNIASTSNNYSPIRSGNWRSCGDGKSWRRRRPIQQGHREKSVLRVPSWVCDEVEAVSDFFVRAEHIWMLEGGGGRLVRPNTDAVTRCHEKVMLLSRDARQKRPYLNCKPMSSSVLTYPPERAVTDHPAVAPMMLVKDCLSCYTGDRASATVLDPFCGSGTTLLAASRLGFGQVVGIDLNLQSARRRIEAEMLPPSRGYLHPTEGWQSGRWPS